MQYQVQVDIAATPEAVWNILMDTARYPEWDPFCDRIEGSLAVGNKIKAYSKLSPGRAFPVKVAELSANDKMVWRGGMPFGLFVGERTFKLERLADGNTRFSMVEVFSGPMLRLIGKSIPDMTEAFEKFGQGLKARAEAAPVQQSA